jgi:hypothetical protein
VIERQYKKLDRYAHFVNPATGESRQVPETWDEDRVKYVAKFFNLQIIQKLCRRIRWTVSADNVVLHDDWSPYKHFTIVPYFPYFRRGKTIGLVENLIDPQELLNKSESQNLHIINTTANSGWKIKSGSLTNMSIEELEERGAETGLVMEISGDPDKDAVKITPNSVPTGHDRLAYKAEEHIKGISGVPDSAQGMDRADVAAKAIQQKKISSKTNLVKPLDSLVRTDYIIGRNTLDLIQEFMSEEQVLTIVKDSITGATEDFTVNEMTPEGEVLNDLTIGEYGIVVSSQPQRETLEDNEFEQLVAMRKDIGIKIPDHVIIDASKLRNKKEIILAMEGDKNSPEAKKQAEQAARMAEATVSKEEGEAAVKHADASLRTAKANLTAEETKTEADGASAETPGTPGLDVEDAARKHDREDEIAQAKIAAIQEKSALERDKTAEELKLKAEAQAQEMAQQRVERMTKPEEGE